MRSKHRAAVVAAFFPFMVEQKLSELCFVGQEGREAHVCIYTVSEYYLNYHQVWILTYLHISMCIIA